MMPNEDRLRDWSANEYAKPGALTRLAARLDVSREAVSKAWREGATVRQIQGWFRWLHISDLAPLVVDGKEEPTPPEDPATRQERHRVRMAQRERLLQQEQDRAEAAMLDPLFPWKGKHSEEGPRPGDGADPWAKWREEERMEVLEGEEPPF
jgi:hypothetical protein